MIRKQVGMYFILRNNYTYFFQIVSKYAIIDDDSGAWPADHILINVLKCAIPHQWKRIEQQRREKCES